MCIRFSKLDDPTAERKQQLEDSLKFQQFSRDVEEEMQWIKEHRPVAESSDYGKSLVGVQNLQKKHQGVLNEVTSYEGNIQRVDQAAKELVSFDHFASDSIEELNRELQHCWKQLKLLAAGRTQKLSDALEAQKVRYAVWTESVKGGTRPYFCRFSNGHSSFMLPPRLPLEV